MKTTLTKFIVVLMIAGLMVGCATSFNHAQLNHNSSHVQDADDETNKYKLTPEERRELVKFYKEFMNPT